MATERRVIRMELNRVEGDMEVKLELDGHTVTDAWCIGTMFRGFEQILVGRDPADALVIAPRICGICSTSQLYAATSALETAYRAADRPQRDAHPQPLPHGRVGDERRAPQLPDVRAGLLQPGLRRPPAARSGDRALRAAVQGPLGARDGRGRPSGSSRSSSPSAARGRTRLHDARRRHLRARRASPAGVRRRDRRLSGVVRAIGARLLQRRVAHARVRR